MNSTTIRLSIMMFLQFFIWGAWYVSLGPYMDANGMSSWIGTAYTVGPIAAVISPFFLGMIADRYFASERVLAAMHIVGGLAMVAAPSAAQISPAAFIGALMLHMLCYMPTLGLTNTLAFHNMQNQEKEFPIVRVFGTVGWIAANWTTSWIFEADREATQFYITAASCFALGGFSLALPHTPPPAKGKKATVGEILGVDALALMKAPSFAVFVVCSFLICIPLAGYYSFAGVYAEYVGFTKVATVMSTGQMSEIIFMLLMPLFFARLGVKWMLAVGMLAWVVRYGLFSAAHVDSVQWMVLSGILLHGICYDFFFVTGFIYTDKKSTKEIRGQAQGLLVLVTQGLGLGIGAQLVQWIVNINTANEVRDWQTIWLWLCIAAGVVLAAFVVLFRDDTKNGVDSVDVAKAATLDEQP